MTSKSKAGSVETQKGRQVARKCQAKPQHEGQGAIVRRSIGRYELKYYDPFLLLDEFSVTAPAGFPDHPHRGFETVTYMLEGAVTHEDFEGHRGTIRGGDLQWMTTGKGKCALQSTMSLQLQNNYKQMKRNTNPQTTSLSSLQVENKSGSSKSSRPTKSTNQSNHGLHRNLGHVIFGYDKHASGPHKQQDEAEP